MKEYKYRHELKFKISESAAEVLKQKLSLIMIKLFESTPYFCKIKYHISQRI